MLLFACCCAVLLCKYYRNTGGRSPMEFLMDSSKQLVGAGWAHVMNLLCAMTLEARFKGVGDECAWYWLNIVLDCTLGVAAEYGILLCLMALIKQGLPDQAEDFETGEYKNEDEEFQLSRYFKQLGLLLLMLLGHEYLLKVALLALSPFNFNSTLKLLAAMIITPFFMNALQFWLVDNFIKKAERKEDDSLDDDIEMEG